MSILLLARHAQASFFDDDYDKLSSQGTEQARQLGLYLTEQDFEFTEVYVGPRLRQRQTLDQVGQAMTAAGLRWPQVHEFPELDEHHLDQLVVDHMQLIAGQNTRLRQLADEFAEAADGVPRQRAFQRLFEAVAQLWAEGKFSETGVETWRDFRRRVNQGFDQIIDIEGHQRHVLVVTSVGPITVALQRALGCSDQTALTTGWRVWNCSLTEFAFSGNRFTLQNFNSLPHLRHRSQWTYR